MDTDWDNYSIKKRVENLIEDIVIKENEIEDNKYLIKEGHNLKSHIKKLKNQMYKEAEELNFEKAAEIRDEINKLQKEELSI